MKAVQQSPVYSRRRSSRVEAAQGVWVYWRCNGRDELSSVHDLSLCGLFIEEPAPRPAGAKVKIDFLVQEGQIRAEAIVRHVKPGRGLGLKLTALAEPDRPRLAALITRLRHLPQFRSHLYLENRLSA